ncbi:unnamed protein product [Callosobruchus maculatus]|uniref:Uncharacterized protein n=1 Tax=Callosobruchus maculatus TaxID=64391 RepID=A0A653BW19_CALMS|nr:unnamed protein product [Callosobruchus maculatus]
MRTDKQTDRQTERQTDRPTEMRAATITISTIITAPKKRAKQRIVPSPVDTTTPPDPRFALYKRAPERVPAENCALWKVQTVLLLL